MSLLVDIMSTFIREKSIFLKVAEGLLHVHGLRLRYLVSCFLDIIYLCSVILQTKKMKLRVEI